MATLKERGVLRQFTALMAAHGECLKGLSHDDAGALRGRVEHALVAQLGNEVFVASARDFANQFGDDWRGASDMEDSVNGALGYDRDCYVRALCALPPAADGQAYVVAVVDALETAAQHGGEHLAKVLAGLPGKVCEAVASLAALGDRGEHPARK